MSTNNAMPSYAGDVVDFVIIGSGAAGGVIARELSRAGHSVVVLEQGPWRQADDFTHDEWSVMFRQEFSGRSAGDYQTFRHREQETAEPRGLEPEPAYYARGVGGSTAHFSGNYWRLRPIDFREHSKVGDVPGATLADWPISYEELEPWYSRAEWEIGVSGAPGPNDPPRSRPYPLPPMPVKSSGILFEKGARALGLTPQVAPVAILSKPYRGRPACINCGWCIGFGCEVNAKSSTLATMIPEALASGNCELRPLSTVSRIEVDDRDRARGVVYFDAEGREQTQRTRSVVLAANGAETPRLLLMSATERHRDGLANSSGMVGRNLMFNAHSVAYGKFEHPLNEYKGIQCTRIALDYYDSDERRGFFGGGAFDARPYLNGYPLLYALQGLPQDAPRWGTDYKAMLEEYYLRNMAVTTAATSLPMLRNNITLDPTHRDALGRPVMRVTYADHPDDLAMTRFLQPKAVEILEAAGAQRTWKSDIGEEVVGAHLLGTCRMGDDPATSVVDRWHRSHDIDNLFICDGSSMVTSGRGQPTLTIQALAFRAADYMHRAARQNAIASAW
jgi:choline dehydrogenase-like flavoprotein